MSEVSEAEMIAWLQEAADYKPTDGDLITLNDVRMANAVIAHLRKPALTVEQGEARDAARWRKFMASHYEVSSHVERWGGVRGLELSKAELTERIDAAPSPASSAEAKCATCGGSGVLGWDDQHGEPRAADCPACSGSGQGGGANQCAGCRQGLPLRDGNHVDANGCAWIGCTANRYAPAPVASVEQGEASMTITDDDAIASGQAFAGPPLDVEEALRILDLEATKFVCAECEARKPPLGSAIQGMRRWNFVDETKLSPLTLKLNEHVSIAFPGYTEVLREVDAAIVKSEIAKAQAQTESNQWCDHAIKMATERDQAREQGESWRRTSAAHQRVAHALQARLGEARKWMQHKDDCGLRSLGGGYVCTCGLDAFLNERPPAGK